MVSAGEGVARQTRLGQAGLTPGDPLGGEGIPDAALPSSVGTFLSEPRSDTGTVQPGWTAKLARWASELAPCAIPKATRSRARHHVLDTLGAVLAGSGHPIPRMLLSSEDVQEAARGGTILGRSGSYRFEACALVNAVAGHVLDLDDQSYSLMGHASVVVLPAILAAAEKARASERAALDAFVVGVEVACKLGAALSPVHFQAGWHTTATVGAFGAAAGCARLWGLPSEGTANAFGLIPIMAGGLRANNGTGAKSLQAGQAALAGLRAVNLSRAGLDASRRILEARDGFVSATNAGAFNPAILDALGEPFEFEAPGMMIKRYPCCSGLGAAIDAVKELTSTAPIPPGEILSVECRVTPLAFRSLPYQLPRTGLEGKFSAPYTVAAALIDGDVTNGTYLDDRALDPAIRHLARLVQLTCDETDGFAPPAGPEGATVSIKTRDGMIRTARVPQPLGGPARPLEWGMLVDKFRLCAEPVLGPRWIEVVEHVEGLGTDEDIAGLMGAMTGQDRITPAVSATGPGTPAPSPST